MAFFMLRLSNVICFLCICANVFTQSKLDSLQQLQEVAVVANRYKEVIPAQTLKGEQLEALNSLSVADAIRYFSGVQIKDYGGIGGLKTVNIRSMGSNHLGVFYDGIQLGNAQNGQVDLGKFSLDNIEEISLYNGQKSEIFQPAKDFGSSGTVYLRTRRPRFEGDKRYNLKAVLRGGSFDLVNPSVLWEQKITGNIASSLNAEYVLASGRYKFRYHRKLGGQTAWDTTAVRRNGDIRALRIEGGLNGYFEQGKWHAKAYFYDSGKGIPGPIVSNVWKHYERQSDRNFFTQASFQKELAPRYELLANVKYANDWMYYLAPDSALMRIENTFLQQEVYVSVAHKYALRPNWDIGLSTDYQWNILDADLRDFVYPKRHTILAALSTAFEWRRWKAQGSLLGTFVFERVTRIHYTDPDDLLPGVQTGTPNDKREFTPAVFVSYQPSEASPWVFRAFYKRIFRMPTLNDLYYTEIGNIVLEPEYTAQYNLGFLYNKELSQGISLRLKADAYYNEVTNKIVAVPSKSGGQFRWTMLNLGYVEIRGADMSGMLAYRPFNQASVSVTLSYTYQRAQDFTLPEDKGVDGGSWGGQIPYIPRHSGSAILSGVYRLWDINYSFIYVGERFHNSHNITANYEPAWYTHDLAIGKRFVSKRMSWKVTVEVNNVLNQDFDVINCYPMPGRNYKVILKMEI
jgi:outer membrane cobalamin receptor